MDEVQEDVQPGAPCNPEGAYGLTEDGRPARCRENRWIVPFGGEMGYWLPDEHDGGDPTRNRLNPDGL